MNWRQILAGLAGALAIIALVGFADAVVLLSVAVLLLAILAVTAGE